MKSLRVVGIVLGIVVALLAAGIVLLPALFDGEKIKGELSRVMLEQKQRKLEIPGKLELSIWPHVSINVGRLTLSEAGGKEEFLALDSARVAVAVMPLLSKQVQVQRVEVTGLKAALVKRRDGTLNIADLLGGGAEESSTRVPAGMHGAGDTASAPVQIDIAGIKLANAQLSWREENSGSTTALSRLDLGTGRVRVDSGTQTLAIENLTLAAALAGSGRTVAMKMLLAAIEGNARALKITSLVLDVDARSAAAAARVHLESPAAANFAARTLALEKITGSIDLAHPTMPIKQLTLPLTGQLRADLAHQTMALDLTTRFDESNIATRIKIAKFTPLVLGFDLDIDQLNADKYLPSAKPKTATDKAADPTSKEDRLDFSALKGLDVNGAIRIGALQVSKLKLARLNAKIALSGGRLEVAPLTLNLYQGAASGSLSFNAAGNSVALRQNLSGISINPLLKDLADKDLVEGHGSVVIDVASRGDSMAAMKQALAGTASVSLRDGAIKGINLAQSLRDFKRKLGVRQATAQDQSLDQSQNPAQQTRAGVKTDFSELGASFKIANGIARNDDLAMKSPFLRLSGAGDLDLAGGQMNYLAKVSVVGTSAGQGGKEIDQLQGISIPLRVSGPFDNLAYKLEFGSLVSAATKARIDEKKQEVKARIEDKAKEKLKGLLGR